jgi:hypothetical protein
MQAFQSDSPERAQRLHAAWTASALAGEMVQHTLQRLSRPDTGGLTPAVLLASLGGVAVGVAVPAAMLAGLPPRDFVQRTRAEQALIGVSASEITRLLLTRWELPAGIVRAAAQVDRGLTCFFGSGPGADDALQSFGYLCLRLGERLAWGERASLQDFDLAGSEDDELAAPRSQLADPAFAALVRELRAPALAARLTAIQHGLQRPARVAPAGARAAAV